MAATAQPRQSERDKLKANAAKTNGNGPGTAVATKKPDPAQGLIALMDGMKKQIALALPKHLTAERMIRLATTLVRINPELLACTKESFIGALFTASALGLEPEPALGLCYLIPRKNGKTGKMEVQFIAGYRGLIQLARRSDQINVINTDVLKVSDLPYFELVKGSGGTYKYDVKAKMADLANGSLVIDEKNDPVVGFVNYVEYKDGSHDVEVMTPTEVNRIRDKYAKGTNSPYSPWNTEPEAMGKKTVIRRHMKAQPLSPEYCRAVAAEGQTLNINTDKLLSLPEGKTSEPEDFIDVGETTDTAEVDEKPQEGNGGMENRE